MQQAAFAVLAALLSTTVGINLKTEDGSFLSNAWLEYRASSQSMPQCNPEGHMVKIAGSLIQKAKSSNKMAIHVNDPGQSLSAILTFDNKLGGFYGKMFHRDGQIFNIEPISLEQRNEGKCFAKKYTGIISMFHKITYVEKKDGFIPTILFNPFSDSAAGTACCTGLFCHAVESFSNLQASDFGDYIYVQRELPLSKASIDRSFFELRDTLPKTCRGGPCDIYYYRNSQNELLEVTPNSNPKLALLHVSEGPDIVLKSCMNNILWTESEYQKKKPDAVSSAAGRVAPGPSCWMQESYCNPLESEQIDFFTLEPLPGQTVDDLAQECYMRQQEDVNANHFTLLKTRELYTCYILRDCYVNSYATCIAQKNCISGPSENGNCADNLPNANCTGPPDLGVDYPKWQCIDKRTNRLGPVEPLSDVLPGVICLLSCASWQTATDSYHPLVQRGYLRSECLRDGTWAETQSIDGSGTLAYPPAPYPLPDATLDDLQAPLKCTCDTLYLNFQGTQYNPNWEEGADFKCTDEDGLVSQGPLPMVIDSHNECYLFCDEILALELKCSNNGWTGEPERGLWCFTAPAVNGVWGDWQSWSVCYEYGNDAGTRLRERWCDSPPAQNGGAPCPGESTNSEICDVDGGFGEWSPWGACDIWQGITERFRLCDSPPQQHGGLDCSGHLEETENCPVNGNWGEWEEWSECENFGPDAGTRTRERLCENPPAQNGGASCSDSNSETELCDVDGNWGDWQAWGECFQSGPNAGTTTRERLCDNPPAANMGLACPGFPTHTESCPVIPVCDQPALRIYTKNAHGFAILSGAVISYTIAQSGRTGQIWSDSNGLAALSLENAEIPTNVHVQITHEGFISEEKDFLINSENCPQTEHYYLTPELAQNVLGSWVMGWVDQPSDLDVHTIQLGSNGHSCRTYYGASAGCEGLSLDYDNTNFGAGGVETTTFHDAGDYTYRLMVHDYSGDECHPLASSGAFVKIYAQGEDSLLLHLNVPTTDPHARPHSCPGISAFSGLGQQSAGHGPKFALSNGIGKHLTEDWSMSTDDNFSRIWVIGCFYGPHGIEAFEVVNQLYKNKQDALTSCAHDH